MNFLSHLQNKSSVVKVQYSLTIAGIITGAIGLVWTTTLPARLAQLKMPTLEITENTKDISNLIGDTKSQLGNILTATKEVVENEANNAESMNALTPVTSTPENNIGSESSEPALSTLETVSNEVIIEIATTTVSAEIPTTTSEVPTTTSPVPQTPKTILIGTTTSQKVE